MVPVLPLWNNNPVCASILALLFCRVSAAAHSVVADVHTQVKGSVVLSVEHSAEHGCMDACKPAWLQKEEGDDAEGRGTHFVECVKVDVRLGRVLRG